MIPNHLKNALDQFSIESLRVEKTYSAIQEQYSAIQQDLQKTHAQLEEKLAELDFVSRYLDAILQHNSQGILFIDFNGMITTCNRSAERLLGVASSDILLCSVWDAFSDDSFGFSLKEILQTQKCPLSTFIDWTLPDSSKLELEIEATCVDARHQYSDQHPPPHHIQGVLILIRNITEIRNLQKIANRQDRLKELGELAARLAHEIRNPLGSIIGFANLLQEDLKDQPEQKHIASLIVEGTRGLNNLVSSILSYSRSLQVHLEDVNLVSLVNELMEQIRADPAFHPSISCKTELQEDALNIPADPSLLKSALLNLLVNALEAMPSEGILKVGLSKNAHSAIIKIKDTGFGIAEENKDKLFSPLFTTKVAGNGFGLSEVYKIIQAHNGTIQVKSEIGEGSEFIIQLPLKPR